MPATINVSEFYSFRPGINWVKKLTQGRFQLSQCIASAYSLCVYIWCESITPVELHRVFHTL